MTLDEARAVLGRRHWSIVAATWFGAGALPRAPGTWGSAGALPFAWAIADFAGPIWLIPAAAILFAVGWAASNRIVSADAHIDPQFIVIDEVVGQFLTLAFAPPSVAAYALGFVAFRIADIVKPWPAGWADREIGGGLGVMLDDVLAAIYSAIVTTAAVYFI
jgi:phosphatidylglycerophosphatase A